MGARGLVSTRCTLLALAKVVLSACLLFTVSAPTAQAQVTCSSGELPSQPLVPSPPDLIVEGEGNGCTVPVNITYYYGNIIIRRGGN
jgi:hypothetical protein